MLHGCQLQLWWLWLQLWGPGARAMGVGHSRGGVLEGVCMGRLRWWVILLSCQLQHSPIAQAQQNLKQQHQSIRPKFKKKRKEKRESGESTLQKNRIVCNVYVCSDRVVISALLASRLQIV